MNYLRRADISNCNEKDVKTVVIVVVGIGESKQNILKGKDSGSRYGESSRCNNSVYLQRIK